MHDIYVLFNKLEHAQLFLEFINKNYKNQLRLTYFKKMKSLSLVFLEKMRLVEYTLIPSVLFHLSTNLVR